MSDENNRVRPFPSRSDREGEIPDPGDDRDLNALLQQWRAPQPPDTLEIRLLESHRAYRAAGERRRRRVRAMASVAATVAIVIGAWWGVSQLQRPNLSAAELLAASSATDRAWLARPQLVVHRTLTVEERRLPENVVVRSQRVDVWQHGSRGLTVRRAYDAESKLVGGEWIDRSSARTLYRPGLKPASIGLDVEAAVREPEHVWRLELSARTFSTFAPASETRVTRSGDRVTLRWDRAAGAGVTQAELTLAGDTLRPVAQTLTIHDADSQSRQFRFEEVAAVEVPSGGVAANRFEPEPALLPAVLPHLAPRLAETRAPSGAAPARRDAALDALELDMWYRAHLLGLTFDRDVRVTRTAADRVQMLIGVANEFRRAALAARLDDLSRHPSIALSFADEWSAPSSAAGDDGDAALGAVLREHFDAQMTAAAAATATQATLASVRTQMDEHRARAGALRAFVARWPPERLNRERKDEVAHWTTIVRDHALSLGESADRLREVLSIVMPPATSPTLPPAASGSPLPSIIGLEATAAIESLLAASRELTSRLQDLATAGPVSSERVDLAPLAESLHRLERAARPFAGGWYFSLD